MKPRERKEQAQKTRLYARKNDHRDILFYNTEKQKYVYHNGLYWTVENDDKVKKEHVAWIKYPKKALMHRVKPFTGWIDVDRQFCYGLSMDGNQRTGDFYKLKNGLVIYCGTYSGSIATTGCYAIEDGIVWHDITSKLSFYPVQQRVCCMGEDRLAYTWGDDYWHGGGDKAHISWTRIYKDDNGEFQVEQESHVLDCDTSWLDWARIGHYVGTVNDTIIVAKEVFDSSLNAQQWFFSIDKNGHVEMLSDPVPQPTWIEYFSHGGDKLTFTQQGNRLFFATSSTHSHDGYRTWITQVVAWMSMDGGATWTKEVLYSGDTLPDYDPQHGNNQHRIEMFQRDGEVFLLFGQACNKEGSGWHEVHLYSTYTGTQWDEIALPSWIEMPVIHEPSGQGVDPASVETLKIAIRPNDTSGQDYNMFDLLSTLDVSNTATMDYQHGNIMFQDGEVKDLLDTDFYMVIGSGNLHLYFDNRYMAESSKAFAWYTQDFDSQADGFDYVIPYDYCAPGRTVAMETEENNG